MGSMRLLFPSLELLERSLASDLGERGRFSRNAEPTKGLKQLVVVIDDGYVTGDERLVTDAGLDSVTVLDLNGARRLRPTGAGCSWWSRRRGRRARRGAHRGRGRAVRDARHASPSPRPRPTARRIGRYRLASAAHIVNLEADARATDPGLMALLKIPDAAEIVPEQVWRQRSPRERLRVPIGYTPNGQPLELDIKESAEARHGPARIVHRRHRFG